MVETMEGIVSTIIPVFNRADLIREAVMSVLLQSHDLVEIIIVNDGSTDGTSLVLEELRAKWSSSISIYHQSNSGPGPARQRGTDNAHGEFIQYLDSDDILFEHKLTLQVAKLKEIKASNVCYMISYQVDHSYTPPLWIGPMRSSGKREHSLFPKLLNERWWTTSSPLYRKSLIKKIPSWLPLKNEEDWVFDAQAGALQTNVCWVEEEGSIRRMNIGEHLSKEGYVDKEKLEDRIIAKGIIYDCATRYGLTRKDKEMKSFARECFFLARLTAGMGMKEPAKDIFRIAQNAGGLSSYLDPRFIAFRLIGQLGGWNNSARMISWIRSKI
jgi:glycosyltransferase involved in cell wall biosynthesis